MEVFMVSPSSVIAPLSHAVFYDDGMKSALTTRYDSKAYNREVGRVTSLGPWSSMFGRWRHLRYRFTTRSHWIRWKVSKPQHFEKPDWIGRWRGRDVGRGRVQKHQTNISVLHAQTSNEEDKKNRWHSKVLTFTKLAAPQLKVWEMNIRDASKMGLSARQVCRELLVM